jgi:hypothetical protein
MSSIPLITWFSVLAVAAPLLASCAEPPKPSYVGQKGPADEVALQECRGEVTKAQMSEAVPADVRAEVAQGAMESCMARRGYYLQ